MRTALTLRAPPSVYDITRRETFDNLSEVWLREVEMYCTVPDCVKLVVGNKARAPASLPGVVHPSLRD